MNEHTEETDLIPGTLYKICGKKYGLLFFHGNERNGTILVYIDKKPNEKDKLYRTHVYRFLLNGNYVYSIYVDKANFKKVRCYDYENQRLKPKNG